MKKFALLGIALVAWATSFSQQEVRIVTSRSAIKFLKIEKGKPTTAIRTVPVKVEYWSAVDSGKTNQTLDFKIAAGSGGAHTPTIASSGPEIPAADFSTDHKFKTFDVSLSVVAVPAFTDASFNITLDVGGKAKDGIHEVVIGTKSDLTDEERTKFDGLKPYWIETGTNIDFVDGPKLNNLTAGIFFQKFDHGWGKDGSKRFASFAGAYEAKIVSDIGSLPFGSDSFVNNKSFMPGKRDTVKVFNYLGKPKRVQTVRNWSFFYSPAYRLSKGVYNDGNFHLYASLWVELRYQEIETKTDNSSLILVDSGYSHIRNLANYHSSDDTVFKSSVYSHYYGIGLPIYYETPDVSLFLNPVIGASNQLSGSQYQAIADIKTNTSSGNPKWSPFYFAQFRLSDSKFGMTVTGEIRGLIKKNSPPQYTIALTKKFNLEKLLTFNNNSD